MPSYNPYATRPAPGPRVPGQTRYEVDDDTLPVPPGPNRYRPTTPTTTPIGNRPPTLPPSVHPPAPKLPPTLTTPPTQPPPVTTVPPPPSASLRQDVYTPGDDPRLKAAQEETDSAASAVQNTRRVPVQQGFEDRYRSIYGTGNVAGDFSDLDGGPNRTALALQKLKDFDAASAETRFNEERALGRNIGKFGRVGLQANADNFGDITRKIAGDRGRLANDLAYNVAEGDINDRFRKVDMKTGLAERNAGRAFERTNAALGAATSQTDRGIQDVYDRYNTAQTLEDRLASAGRSNRDEYRTERGRQDTQARQTIEDRIRERELMQQEEEMRLRRAALQGQAGGL